MEDLSDPMDSGVAISLSKLRTSHFLRNPCSTPSRGSGCHPWRRALRSFLPVFFEMALPSLRKSIHMAGRPRLEKIEKM